MNKNIHIVCSLICAMCGTMVMSAQTADSTLYHTTYDTIVNVIQYADTIRPTDLINVGADDTYLLDLLQQSNRQRQAREDSLRSLRLATDTTTLNPFHVGFADSLRMAADRERFPYNLLAIPLQYVPLRRSSKEMTEADDVLHYSNRKLYEGARQYIIANYADLLIGVYTPTKRERQAEQHMFIPSLKVERSLVYDPDEDRRDALRKRLQERSPWFKEATIMLQLTQNYVSHNWYQGGNSNFALLGVASGKLNYNDKKRITWENTGEWRVGASTVSGDTLRKVNTTDDLFRLYSKLGIKVYNNLYGSMSAEFQTQLFRTWKTNTKELKTGPLTPLRFNVAFGIDYKPVKGLSVSFSPLAYKLVYANDTIHVSQTGFSIPAGQKVLNDVGSSLRVEWTWKPVREIALESKFYFYTNYKKVEIDWETTCNFIINRYLSARIMLHPRYDNTVILEDQQRAKLQFKELISLGFAHKFY